MLQGFFGAFSLGLTTPKEALDWLKEFEVFLNEKDLDYLERICPTQSFAIWLPMVRLFAAYFEYKAGSPSKAEQSLGMLSRSKQREFQEFVHSQSQNTNLEEDHRNCWVEMEYIVDELLGARK